LTRYRLISELAPFDTLLRIRQDLDADYQFRVSLFVEDAHPEQFYRTSSISLEP